MLRISLLGEQSIVDADTGAARSRSARTLALAAFLVVHAGSPQPRQRIAGLFWPDSTDAQALTNLRRELHTLRNALAGEPCLVVTANDLCWQDGGAVAVDLRVFDREYDAARRAEGEDEDEDEAVATHVDAALAAYRGDLLPGLHDDWVLEARAEVQDRAVRLCALACAVRTRLGAPAAALDAARLWVRLRPLEEAGHRALMRLQAALGDRAAALGAYHRCASVLERELGVEPDEATRAVFRQLLAQPAPPAVGPVASGTSAFVGRDRELAALHAAWRGAAAGRPGVVLVSGGAGVGKTRLVAELAATARRAGAVTATARCFATSGRLALAPVAEWLRAPEVQVAVARLDPVWRAEVHRLVPPPSEHGVPGSLMLVDAWQRHRFFEGLARALLGVGRPTLLVLDDVQWCDEETLAFLGFCLALVPQAPVLLAATQRTDDPSGGAEPARWTARLPAGLLTDVPLGPLAGAETARLAEAVRGAPLPAGDRALLAAVTGGFPLHVVEAMRAVGRGSLPAGDLDAVLGDRLGQASPAAQEVAGLASAVGRDVTLDLLVAAGDRDADGVVAAVDELWRLRILREHGTGYVFSHDLLRDAAYARITPARRWLLHRRVAAGLEQLHADDTGPVAAQLAEQYARGGRPERAVVHYRRAAEVAAGVFAHAEALRAYDGALEIVRARAAGHDRDADELAVLEGMAAPLNARCGYADAELQRVLERSVALAESLGRRGSLIDALVSLYASRIVQGRVVEAHEVALRALDLVDGAGETAGAAHFTCGGALLFLGRPAESVAHFATSAALAKGMLVMVGTRTDVHGQAWAAHAHWLCGDDTAAEAAAREAIALSRSLDHPYSLAVALSYAAITWQLRGDRSELRRTVVELGALCARYDFGYYREWGLVLDGWCRGGREGVDLARRGVANLVADGALLRRPYWLALLADLLDGVGERDAARATLDDAAADARARDEVWWLPEVLRLRAAYDTPDAAVTRLREAADLATAHGSAALLRRIQRDLTRVVSAAAEG